MSPAVSVCRGANGNRRRSGINQRKRKVKQENAEEGKETQRVNERKGKRRRKRKLAKREINRHR